jgi:hypothetical protein
MSRGGAPRGEFAHGGSNATLEASIVGPFGLLAEDFEMCIARPQCPSVHGKRTYCLRWCGRLSSKKGSFHAIGEIQGHRRHLRLTSDPAPQRGPLASRIIPSGVTDVWRAAQEIVEDVFVLFIQGATILFCLLLDRGLEDFGIGHECAEPLPQSGDL